MKKLLIIPLMLIMLISVGCDQEQTAEFTIETIAMAIGYDMADGFDWNEGVDKYYNAIMEGKLSIDAAQAAESYLRTVTHPVISNRMVSLASKIGFDIDDLGGIVGVDNVDIHLLQVAAQGFRLGVTLKPPQQALKSGEDTIYSVGTYYIDENLKFHYIRPQDGQDIMPDQLATRRKPKQKERVCLKTFK